MAFGTKTNERPGTRAQARHIHMSAYKAREVLDLIRGAHVADADEILAFVERDAAIPIRKLLASAIANAETNDEQDAEQLFVSACYADEGPTQKRWRPRARGRATRIRKRTCHITIIVSRLSDQDLARRNARTTSATAGSGRKASARAGAARSARVARSREAEIEKAGLDPDAEVVDTDMVTTADAADETTTDETKIDEAEAPIGDADEGASRSSADDVTQIDEVGEGEAEDEANVKEADVTEAEEATDAPDESGSN